jgi:hypothetical protein
VYQKLARDGKLTCRIDLRWPIAFHRELSNTGAMADFGSALGYAEVAPAATAALAATRCFRAHVPLAGFGVGEVESFLGADRPPRHQQRLVVDRDRIRVDDPQIHSCDSIRVHVRRLDGDGGGDVNDEASGVDEQRH